MNRLQRLTRSLTNHKPNIEQQRRIESIRMHAKQLAGELDLYLPESREAALAFTHLEETVMWAVKAVILDEEIGSNVVALHPEAA